MVASIRRGYRNLRRFLSGEYVCVECGRVWYGMSFGFGKFWCPDCWSPELDRRYGTYCFDDYTSFWNRLNRVAHRAPGLLLVAVPLFLALATVAGLVEAMRTLLVREEE